MKKVLVFLVIAISILTALLPAGVGAAAGDETWRVFEARGGQVYCELIINVNNLKTSQFTVVNNSESDVVYFFIYDTRTRTLVFSDYITASAGQTVTRNWVFNYMRQSTDPDSYPIRMPSFINFSFGTGSPADNGIS